VGCYRMARQEGEKMQGDTGARALINTCLKTVVAAVTNHLIIESSISSTRSPIYPLLTSNKFPLELLAEILDFASALGHEVPDQIIGPLLHSILVAARGVRILSMSPYVSPLDILNSVLELRLGSGSRPCPATLCSLPVWLPPVVSTAGGREVAVTSFLGPFFSPSVFPEEDTSVADSYFNAQDNITTHHIRSAASALQPSLELLRTKLHQAVHNVLANKTTRLHALQWLQVAIERNSKRTQMKANERLVAGDGWMLNLVSVLQHLCAKVKLDKVDPEYPHLPGARVDFREESRLKADTKEVEKLSESLKAKGGQEKEANFQTECWFLTLQAHHVGVLPVVRRYLRRVRALKELQKAVDELEKSENVWRNLPSAQQNRTLLKRWKQQIKKQSKSRACADVGLMCESLFSRCLQFYGSVGEHILRLCDPLTPLQPRFPLSQVPSTAFSLLPEWVVDDLADFLLFGLQFLPVVVANNCPPSLVTLLLTCSRGLLLRRASWPITTRGPP